MPMMQLGNIHVMGDINGRNLTEMKAYSKVEVQVDMLALYKQAYDDLEVDFAGADSVEFSDIPEPAPTTSQTFTEKIANSLIDSYKEGTTMWDEYQWEDLNSFKQTLEEIIEEEKL